jgi:transitional endoplasmic reticulum ATPase
MSSKKAIENVSFEPRIWIELDLKPSKQASNTNDLDQKNVLLHPNDAAAVDIRDGEPALLIVSHSADESIGQSDSLNAAICKVRVSSADFISPKKKKEVNVLEGEIHLLSSWLSAKLIAGKKTSDSLVSGATSVSPAGGTLLPTLQTPSSASPAKGFSFARGGGGQSVASRTQKTTPSKSGVSFAKGGGGDALISPPKHSTPSKSGFSFAKGGRGDALISPQKNNTPSSAKCIRSNNKSQKCILVPLHNLSKKQSGQLCGEAEKLVVAPVRESCTGASTTNADNLESLVISTNIIQTLIASKYKGSYICSTRSFSTANTSENFEVVSIVFRGQNELFHVMNVTPQESRRRDDLDTLSQTIDNIKLSDSSNASSTQQSTALEGLLNNKRGSLIGLRMTPKTRIEFIDDVQHIKNDETTNDENSNLCAGLDSTLSWIRDALIPPLLNPSLFPTDGPLRPPKGALLFGPAGVGKSLAAAQIAHDLSKESFNGSVKKIHVQNVQCADLLASTAIVGEAENMLTGIFQEAEREASVSGGSLVILDDVQLICPRRGGIGSGSGGLGVDQLAGTLLALLDGIGTSKSTSKGGVVVLAITTEPSLLDPALRRAGRLDAEIEVPVPDDNAREEILGFHIAQLASVHGSSAHLDLPISNVQLKALARLAKGFTGADCKLAVKEATRTYLKRVNFINNQASGLPMTYADFEHGIRSTKPSAIKSVAVEVPHVPWSSIGGMDHVKSLLRESIELPLTHPHLFEMMNVPPPKGILLYGPPGCSKTLMARAIATEGNMNFLAVKGPELLSKWLGESERALASLFRRARLATPSVIFFDEVDAIAGKRGEGGGGGGDRLLSQLLTELDGVTSGKDDLKKPRVVVVGATNRPDTLDPALTRPGRMDRMIYVGLPDSDGRKSIFDIGLKGKACHNDVDVSVLLMMLYYLTLNSLISLSRILLNWKLSLLAGDDVSKGYSGAEIIAICRDAALHAIGEMTDGSPDTPQICMRHLLQSIKDMKPRTTQDMLNFYKSFRGQH